MAEEPLQMIGCCSRGLPKTCVPTEDQGNLGRASHSTEVEQKGTNSE